MRSVEWLLSKKCHISLKSTYDGASFVKAIRLGLKRFKNRTLLQLHSCGLYETSQNSFLRNACRPLLLIIEDDSE